MTKEQINEYTLRISHANSTELVIILYDMTILYLKDAMRYDKLNDADNLVIQARNALKCVEEMQLNLHYEYELARMLKQIYLYMKKELRNTIVGRKAEGLQEVASMLESLKQAYENISDIDKSAPIMMHTQSVISGMTYSRNKLLNDLTTEVGSRGFIV